MHVFHPIFLIKTNFVNSLVLIYIIEYIELGLLFHAGISPSPRKQQLRLAILILVYQTTTPHSDNPAQAGVLIMHFQTI